MRMYPVYGQLAKKAENFRGNFGLWFNKLTPIQWAGNTLEAWDKPNEKNDYLKTYNACTGPSHSVHQKLAQKLNEIREVMAAMEQQGGQVVSFRFRLLERLITGIGIDHMGEVGIRLDRNLGLPYLPSTGIKGIVRLAHILNMAEQVPDLLKGDCFQERDQAAKVGELFGLESKKDDAFESSGAVIFLDAYPEKVPQLDLDIINPHYPDYYQNPSSHPPSDNQNPKPIKFLAVSPGMEITVRCVLLKRAVPFKDLLQIAVIRAFTEIGFGAKTSIGYGRFEVLKGSVNQSQTTLSNPQDVNKDPAPKLSLQEEMAGVFDGLTKSNKNQSLDQIDAFVEKFLKAPDPSLARELKNHLHGLGEYRPQDAKREDRKQVLQKRYEVIQKLLA